MQERRVSGTLPGMKLRLLLVICCLAACGDDSRPGRADTGTGGDTGGGADTGSDAMMSVDAPVTDTPFPDTGPPLDPFDPANGCGATAIETQVLPGSVLLAFDQSASMQGDTAGNRPPERGPSKWTLATEAITSVLASMPDELNVGLLLFPDPGGGSECSVAPTPQVGVAPLATTRAMINSTLARSPNGGQTPAIAAVNAGWEYMLPLPLPGERGVILVTDGGETCDTEPSDTSGFHMQARTNDLAFGVSSYAVGLTTTNNLLSGLAFNGGTARSETCMPMCTTNGERCMSNAECGGGTCFNLPIVGQTCTGGPSGECCHYDISEAALRDEFEMALREIAESFLDSCVFELPNESDDPALVNVGVTFDGEERRVLRRSDDPADDSWNYTPTGDSIVIQGALCDELLAGDAVVEIVLGCPTILI